MEKTVVEKLIQTLYDYEQRTKYSLSFAQMKPLLEKAKEMELKQRQEDKLTGMKEANELLDELIEKNMCSNSGDILIKQFKKRINL